MLQIGEHCRWKCDGFISNHTIQGTKTSKSSSRQNHAIPYNTRTELGEQTGFSIPILGRAERGKGNGNPLRYSCLENPRDGEAWWAAIYGVGHDWSDLAVAAVAERGKELYAGS